jgi:hypothetical protein
LNTRRGSRCNAADRTRKTSSISGARIQMSLLEAIEVSTDAICMRGCRSMSLCVHVSVARIHMMSMLESNARHLYACVSVRVAGVCVCPNIYIYIYIYIYTHQQVQKHAQMNTAMVCGATGSVQQACESARMHAVTTNPSERECMPTLSITRKT